MKPYAFSYVALIRGIMPANPNARNEKLKAVLEGLGFKDVHPIISSGNVVFRSKISDRAVLEEKIEKALADKLQFKNHVMVRSLEDLKKLIAKDPFKGKEHGRKTYLVVTFFKKKPGEIFTAIDLEKSSGANFMAEFEKTHGKDITTRTWKTVERIVKKMESLE